VPLLCGLPGAPCVPWLLHHPPRGPARCPGAVTLGWCLEPCPRWPCFTIKVEKMCYWCQPSAPLPSVLPLFSFPGALLCFLHPLGSSWWPQNGHCVRVRGQPRDRAQRVTQCGVFNSTFLRAENKRLLGKKANAFYRAGG